MDNITSVRIAVEENGIPIYSRKLTTGKKNREYALLRYYLAGRLTPIVSPKSLLMNY